MFRKRYKNWRQWKKFLRKKGEEVGWGTKEIIEGIQGKNKKFRESINFHQLQTEIEGKELKSIFEEMGIKPKDGLIVSEASYVGKVPRALDEIGYKVVFTDISKDFVDLAKKGRTLSKDGEIIPAKKLKAFQLDIRNPHINDARCSAIVSYEGTPYIYAPYKAISPNLGAKNGLVIMAEAYTFLLHRWERIADTLEKSEYEIQHKSMNTKNIYALQLKIPENKKEMYLIDREAFEMLQRFRSKKRVAEELEITKEDVTERVKRFKKIFSLKKN